MGSDVERCILLATYNGGRFLAEQLESIYGQSEVEDWHLLVRDDGSSDESRDILRACARKYGKMFLVEDGLGQLGAKGNFAHLLELARARGASFCCFSDQDDVWRRDKIALQAERMRELSAAYPNKPLMVHSDMEVVDAALGCLHRSFMGYQGIHHQGSDPLRFLLTQNFVTGCTVMINRALLEVATPVPEEALMHDWWLALCAASLGHIAYVDGPLLKYRQHGGNEVGAKRLHDYINPLKTKWFRQWSAGRGNLQRSMAQALALARRIRSYDPSNPHLERIERYASLAGLRPLRRLSALRQLGVHAQSQTRHALLLSRLLSLPRTKYG